MSDKMNEIQLDITSEVAQGTYSNLVVITHSPTEMIFDFAQMFPGTEHTVVRERIIMDPVHAKRLLAALQDNISKYEANYGKIVAPEPLRNPDGSDKGRSGNVPFPMDPMGDA